MNYVELGDSGIEVSRVCVGGMSFGDRASKMHAWTLDAAATDAMVAHALELGINFFDTANCYSDGTSEEYLGAAIARHARREDVVLASKVYFNEGRLSAAAIEREIEGTLRRLGTDYLDLYIIHRFDYDTPIEETCEALDALVRAGKVRALGASAMFGYQFHKMLAYQHGHGLAHFVSMQDHYNLVQREDEREMIPVCREYGVSLTPYSSLAAGRLARPDWHAKTLRSDTDVVARSKYDGTEEADKLVAARVRELAERRGVSMTEVALAWHYAKGVASPIIGSTRPEQYDDAARACELGLSAEEVAFLEEPYVPHWPAGPRLADGSSFGTVVLDPLKK